MSQLVGQIRLDTRELDRIAKSLNTNADGIVGNIAGEVEQEAKITIQKIKLIKTGALYNSIKARPVKPKLWYVEDGVDYGLYWEVGHHRGESKTIYKRPFMVPAIEQARKRLAEKFKGLFK